MTNESDKPESHVNQLRLGGRESLAELFALHRARLRNMVRLRMDPRLAPRFDPSDVLQEAYLDAQRQIGNYLKQPRVAFYVWLRGLAWERLLNLQRMHLGAQCRAIGREMALPAESAMHLADRLLARGSSPSQRMARDELRQRVQQALDRLSADDREVILMRHFEEMSNGEVADALGINDSAATMRYGRALFRLKELLQRTLLVEDYPQ